ncbi:hypothetical protein [uncultured Psychromonas sp.]|uniref:DODA-type extradiol aromatic ring-opening family dioxygenase n=1 Tax=uncultured Psychromonas sp. TaxID=173974 RepID=UPI002611C8B8|nr:hypothetical protein [uncultured Psychromonas sp.]
MLAEQIQQALKEAEFPVIMDYYRGYDHGLYVPLTLMYPDADISSIQLSLVHHLDAKQHLTIGYVLQSLDYENLLVMALGFSFHNMKVFKGDQLKNRQFDD